MRSTILRATLLSLFLTELLGLSAKAQTTVISADPKGNPNSITVVYSAAMDPASSIATANYSLTNAAGTVVAVTGAALAVDQVTVQLQLGSSLQLFTNYTLVISNVKDSTSSLISPNPTLVNFYFGGNPSGATFTFDDGLVPSGTRLAVGPDTAGNAINPSQGVTNAAGFKNSGALILTIPSSGQSFAQWRLTNDFAGGVNVTNLKVTFKLLMGNGTGGSTPPGLPNGGGNGVLFHWGPGLLEQYTGGASSWGSGLDLTFRAFNSAPNIFGVSVYYGGTAGAGNNTPVANVPYMGYFQTNGPLDDFSEAVDVSLSISNGLLNLTVTPTNGVSTNVYANYSIAGFPAAGLPLGGNNLAFTATDGSGAHESAWLDNVDLFVNGKHVPANATPVGPIGITRQPASQTNLENVYVSFNVGVTGAPTLLYQWFSNSVAIPGATAASYKTPLTLYAMNGTHYAVAISNSFSGAVSSDAILTIIKDTNGIQVASVGSVAGGSIGIQFSGLPTASGGAFVDTVTGGNPANYSVTDAAHNPVNVTAATVRSAFANFGDPVLNYPSYQKTVRLTLATPVTSGYTVTVKPGVLSRTGIPVAQSSLVGNVAGMTDVDLAPLGSTGDPLSVGEAFSAGDRQVEVIAGGSDSMAIAAAGISDHGHYGYVERTGNFDIAAKLVWATLTANGAKAGLMVRPVLSFNGNDSSSPAIAATLFPPAPGRATYETAARTNYGDRCWSWSAPGVAANGNVGAYWPINANWVRIRRLGPTFLGYASPDGATWNLIGSITTDTNIFGPVEFVGLEATAGNNDGRLTEVNFQNWGPTVFPDGQVRITSDLSANYANIAYAMQTFTIAAVADNVPTGELSYQWQRQEAGGGTFGDILLNGNASSYTTPPLNAGNDNGAKYRVIAFVGDLSSGHSVTSRVGTLTVTADTTPPYMVSAYADATFQQISINFNKAIDYGSAANTVNYALAPGGGSAITMATPTLSADGVSYTNVILSLANALSSGAKYILTVANVLDLSANNINNTAVAGGKSRVLTGWVLAYGYLRFDRWQGPQYPSGAGPYYSDVAHVFYNLNYPSSPDNTQLITISGFPNGANFSNPATTTAGDVFDFSGRVSGFFIPPANGSYQFYVRGNDGNALWVSATNTLPDPMATNPKAVDNETFGSGRSWLYSITNLANGAVNGVFYDSTPVTLNGGQPYGVVALFQQANGGSCLEFTWGAAGAATIFNGDSVNNSLNSNYRTFAGMVTNTYNITGTNIATYVNPDASVITATGLTNTSVQQFRTATFAVAATAAVSAGAVPSVVPVTYQWAKGGVNITGATASSYATPPAAYPADNGAVFSVVMSVAGVPFMTITNSATLTVVPITTAPIVTSASSFGGTTIGLRFGSLMDPASSTNAANYTAVSGSLSVSKAQLRSDGQTVLLTLTGGTLAGPTFSVTINNVKDLAGNTIIASTVATGNVLLTGMSALDIGVGTNALGAGVVQTNAQLPTVTIDVNYPGSSVMAQDGVFEVVASGQDIGNSQDGLHYIFEQRGGDFDVKVRVERIDGSSARAKAGLMMRESLSPGSRDYSIVVEPAATNSADGSGLGFNGVEILRRTTNNLAQLGFANNPAAPVLGNAGAGTNMYPVWLRMRRTGNNVYVYTGPDGTNWYLCGRETGTTASGQTAWPATVYVGLATTAHTNSIYTQSRFSQYGSFLPPARQQVLLVASGNGSPATQNDTPAANPNAPALWFSTDLYKYNLLVGLGYNVTVVQDNTSRTEDATGMSLVMWDGSVNSGNVGGKFRMVPVPVIVSKPNSLEDSGKMGWVKNTTDRNFAPAQLALQIVNTNNPIVKGLFQTNQLVTVSFTPQYFCYAATNMPGVSGLGSAFTVVAVSTTNAGQATIYYANPTATNAGGIWGSYPNNYVAHRRVGLWLGDNGVIVSTPITSPGDWAQITGDGTRLLLNAINWAIATNEPPYITNQPASLTVAAGATASFSVTPAGPGPYTYQWYENSALVSGAIYADYTHSATTLADNGDQLQVVLTGLYGSVTSSVATLTVQTPIAITGQPTNTTAVAGSTATFTVSAIGSSPAYQWSKIIPGTSTNAISGATSASYTTPALTAADNGTQFRVVVNNLVNSITSATATLTVVANNPPVFSSPMLSTDGSHLTLTWSGGGFLLQATNLTGPWVTNGATSPATITINPATPRMFYRVQQ